MNNIHSLYIDMKIDMQELTQHSRCIIQWEFYPRGLKLLVRVHCFIKGHTWRYKRIGIKYCALCTKQTPIA